MNILITGATGNIGGKIIEHFDDTSDSKIFAAVHGGSCCRFPNRVEKRAFDFHDLETARAALDGIDVVFLLRPPKITDIRQVFEPLIRLFAEAGIKHVVFLSVQGAETQPLIPHHKIENLLRKSGLRYTFVRPGYFMQNLTTTLWNDIQRGEIYLPSAMAKFNWVDTADIGRAIVAVLKAPERHMDKAYVITGQEQLDFHAVAEMISRVTGRPVRFTSPSLVSFFVQKKREGERTAMIFVLILLHFFPRFLQAPPLSGDFTALTGRQPGKLEEFLKREMMPALG